MQRNAARRRIQIPRGATRQAIPVPSPAEVKANGNGEIPGAY